VFHSKIGKFVHNFFFDVRRQLQIDLNLLEKSICTKKIRLLKGKSQPVKFLLECSNTGCKESQL